MTKVVIDTSIFIDHLRGTSADFKRLESERLAGNLELLVPHVVIIELFAGREARKRRSRDVLDRLLSGFPVVGLSVWSAKMSGGLIRAYPQIPDPFDLLIAAIALEQEAVIATHNEKHFKQISDVALFDFGKN